MLRQGVASGFRPPQAASGDRAPGGAPAARRPGRRSAFRRWSAVRPFAGRWRAIPAPAAGDLLDEEERNRERARQLVERYGVVFRELLANEGAALAWSRLARTLRAMELSGELVGGHFVAGVAGLQFATPALAARLAHGLGDGGAWWHNAADPVSLCGVGLPGLREELPRRLATTRLAWRGSRLLAVFRRSGRDLDLRVAAGDPSLPALLEPLRVALARSVGPVRGIAIETINGEPAATSPYRAAFEGFSVVREGGGLRLRRRYG